MSLTAHMRDAPRHKNPTPFPAKQRRTCLRLAGPAAALGRPRLVTSWPASGRHAGGRWRSSVGIPRSRLRADGPGRTHRWAQPPPSSIARSTRPASSTASTSAIVPSTRKPSLGRSGAGRRPPARMIDSSDLGTVTEDERSRPMRRGQRSLRPPRRVRSRSSEIKSPSASQAANTAPAVPAPPVLLRLCSGNALWPAGTFRGRWARIRPGTRWQRRASDVEETCQDHLDRNYINRARLADLWCRPRASSAGCQRRRSRSSR
jgi:hypothetical protein